MLKRYLFHYVYIVTENRLYDPGSLEKYPLFRANVFLSSVFKEAQESNHENYGSLVVYAMNIFTVSIKHAIFFLTGKNI